MPKIRIREQDNTGTVISGTAARVVYVPAVAPSGKAAQAAKLYYTATALEAANVEGLLYDSSDTTHYAYLVAKHLLNIGFYVIFETIVSTTETSVTAVPEASWTALEDKNEFDVNFLTTGDFPGMDAHEITCAKNRGDCTALVDHVKSITPDSGKTYADKVREVLLGATASEACANGEYAAAFTPWIKVNDGIDFTTDREIPASYGYLFAYANSSKNAPEYQAIAGPTRGVIPELVDVLHYYTTAEVKILTKSVDATESQFSPTGDGVGILINPIYNVRPNGLIIYGNRTLRKNEALDEGAVLDIAADTKATSYLNIRVMIGLLKKKLYEAARYYTFEQNTNILWVNFQSQVTPLLDEFYSGGGINGYRFHKETTAAKARLKASLDIVPVEAVEDFDLMVNLENDLEITEG